MTRERTSTAKMIEHVLRVAQQRTLSMDEREANLYEEARQEFLKLAQSPSVSVMSEGSARKPSGDTPVHGVAPRRNDARKRDDRPLTIRVNTEEFAKRLHQAIGRGGRRMSEVEHGHILVAVDTAVRQLGQDPDLQALGRVAHVVENIYRKYQRMVATTDATEKAVASGLHRETVSALRARGPYSGFGGRKISMM